ncbi:Mitochondrial metal transporter 2, partial [Pseudocercospora fuligena]
PLRCNTSTTAVHIATAPTATTAHATAIVSPIAAGLRTSRVRVRNQVQRRILLTLAPSARPVQRLRSPHQWAHIVHHSRQPQAVAATSPTVTMPTQTTQKRTHAGHSHGHGHHHHHGDNAYLTSSNKNDPGVRITRVGLYVNLGMAIAKGAGGYVFNSKALTADAVHALTDLISDITTLATISWSLKPATTKYPMGYGKIESLGALAVSCILLGGGIGIGLQAVLALSQQFFPQIHEVLSHLGFLAHSHSHGHDHGHGHIEVGPNINAAWLAAGSIVVKEWLYRATMKIAKEKRSSVLSSNASILEAVLTWKVADMGQAYHHRVDSLTAFVALFTIVASNFMESARWLDPVGGLIISGMIVQAGWGNTMSALYELADKGMDEELREKAETTAVAALESYKRVQIRGVQGIKSGQNLMFEVEIGVPKDWTVAHTQDVEQLVRDAIANKVRGTKRVTIRFTTSQNAAFSDEFVSRDNDTAIEEDHDHDHAGHDHGHNHVHANGHSHEHANGTTKKRK